MPDRPPAAGADVPQAYARTVTSRRDLVIGASLLVIALAYFSLTFPHTFELRDEGYILYNSARAAVGEVPHRDVFGVYGPGVFEVTGVALRLGHGRIFPVRVMLAALKALAVALTFFILRFLVPRGFAFFGALLAIVYWGRLVSLLNVPYAVLYTTPLCLAGLLCVLYAQAHRSVWAYGVAGLLFGTGVLFKQSLAAVVAYGMFLAVFAVGVIEENARSRDGAGTRIALIAWTLAGLVLVAPFASLLTVRDYAVHFLPAHLLMLLIGIAIVSRGTAVPVAAVLKRRLLPLALGSAVAPCLTAMAYAHWHSLGKLVYDMFIFPQTLTNYYLAAALPALDLSEALAGIVLLISAGLVALRGRIGGALLFAGSALVLFFIGGRQALPTLFSVADWDTTSNAFAGAESATISAAALAALFPAFLRPNEPGHLRLLRNAVPLLFFHATISLEAFPRAGIDLWLLQPALVPLLAVVVFWWYRLGAASTGAVRHAVAALLVALLPIWLTAPVAFRAVRESAAPHRALALPASAGIALSAFDMRWMHVDEFERLIAYLRTAEPRQAPIFALTNEEMLYFLSGHRHLFPKREPYLFLLGWGMLPAREIEALDVDAMIRRLRSTPDVLVIDRDDDASGRLRAALPTLSAFLSERFAVSATIGGYRVLRPRQG